LCQYLVNIPTNPEYGSLNLAMAVQVICYELRMAAMTDAPGTEVQREAPPASASELEGFHEHLERLLSDSGFLNASHPHTLKLRLRRLFQRAELDRNEINILRGVLTSLDPDRRRP
jgi:tRNA C32,U32 (ribose-2'-O)-methylase TrmJ